MVNLNVRRRTGNVFGQIENGIRNRRDEPEVQHAEQAALTKFLPDYNETIKEIEDILAEAESEEPIETTEETDTATE